MPDCTTIAAILHRVARGRHGHEHLSMSEAESVLGALLESDADPLQLGAFLIAQRMKGETPEELAGFVRAARQRIAGFGSTSVPEGTVDLPCYAGKRRAAPLHLAAALKARDAGIRIIVHGVSTISGRVSAWEAMEAAGVRRAESLQDAESLLADDGIVYLDMADICPPLYCLLQLRPRLGVRTFANTVARLLNPLKCPFQLNGVFHTPYAQLMAQANVLLDQPRSLIFMGAEGEPELYADRQKVVKLQIGGDIRMLDLPDMGCDFYPKMNHEPSDIADYFRSILHQGQMDAREAATLERMQYAFRWAATGELPKNWTLSEE